MFKSRDLFGYKEEPEAFGEIQSVRDAAGALGIETKDIKAPPFGMMGIRDWISNRLSGLIKVGVTVDGDKVVKKSLGEIIDNPRGTFDDAVDVVTSAITAENAKEDARYAKRIIAERNRYEKTLEAVMSRGYADVAKARSIAMAKILRANSCPPKDRYTDFDLRAINEGLINASNEEPNWFEKLGASTKRKGKKKQDFCKTLRDFATKLKGK